MTYQTQYDPTIHYFSSDSPSSTVMICGPSKSVSFESYGSYVATMIMLIKTANVAKIETYDLTLNNIVTNIAPMMLNSNCEFIFGSNSPLLKVPSSPFDYLASYVFVNRKPTINLSSATLATMHQIYNKNMIVAAFKALHNCNNECSAMLVWGKVPIGTGLQTLEFIKHATLLTKLEASGLDKSMEDLYKQTKIQFADPIRDENANKLKEKDTFCYEETENGNKSWYCVVEMHLYKLR